MRKIEILNASLCASLRYLQPLFKNCLWQNEPITLAGMNTLWEWLC